MGMCYSLSSKELVGMQYHEAKKLVEVSRVFHEPSNRRVSMLRSRPDYPIEGGPFFETKEEWPCRLTVYVDRSCRITRLSEYMG